MKALVRVLLCCRDRTPNTEAREITSKKDESSASLDENPLNDAVAAALKLAESPEPEPHDQSPQSDRQDPESVPEPEGRTEDDTTPSVVATDSGKRRKKSSKKRKDKARRGSQPIDETDQQADDIQPGMHKPLPPDAKPRRSILKKR